MAWRVLAGTVVLLLAGVFAAGAVDLRYLGRDDSGRALLETGAGQAYRSGVGDAVPGFGAVVEITDNTVVLRRLLTQQEKNALRQGGWAVYDAERLRVTRDDLRLLVVPLPDD